MFKLNYHEIWFIALVLEGFFYGLYSAIFAMYFQYQTSKKDTDKKQYIVFYSICALYVLSVALFVADIVTLTYQLLSKPMVSVLPISLIQMTLFGCSDVIAQFILIYRCWIVWGCNIRVVIIPSMVAFAFLVIWLTGGNSMYISSDDSIITTTWGNFMALSGVALSLTVNALVTGLIVFRIFKVFREVKATDDQILGVTGGSKLRRIMLILIESGMALFSIQLARLVITIVVTDATNRAFLIIATIHEMLNGITPTIILVRTSMGLSFYDEKSMEEVATGSLRFASNYPNLVQEMGNINIVSQDNRDGDIGVDRSDDINIADEMKRYRLWIE